MGESAMDDEWIDRVRGQRRWKAMAGAWRAVVSEDGGSTEAEVGREKIPNDNSLHIPQKL